MTEESTPPFREPDGGDGVLDEFRALVRAAFEQAQVSGKSNWTEMTSAVLKNRILNITGNQFSQSRYGSPSFIALVRRIPDLVEVIDDKPPFGLRIRVTADDGPSLGPSPISEIELEDAAYPATFLRTDWPKVRIRDDLWKAIVDYGSGIIYVLDSETGIARPQEVTDLDAPVIPTARPDEIASWRREFIDQLDRVIKERRESELEEWAAGSGRQADLPRPIRGRWAEYLKQRVARKLVEWYKDTGQSPPIDTLLKSEARGLPRSGQIEEVVRTGQLRDLIIRAIRTMSHEELAKLTLPAEVLLRVSRRIADGDD